MYQGGGTNIMADKIIVTNWEALKRKYHRGIAEIEDRLQRLIDADADRGMLTQVVRLDDPVEMGGFGAPAINHPDSPKQAKEAIDAVYNALMPDYLVILGSTDIIPHQRLANPLEDADPLVESDLPYACDAPYSESPERFLGPTRVAGRVPDLTGATDPDVLLAQLRIIKNWKTRTQRSYADFFGLTAEVWRNSTRMSLTKLFSTSAGMHVSPPSGPRWGSTLNHRCHFINCHGASYDPSYYGEDDYKNFEEAHTYNEVKGSLKDGTVAAAECCYGAQLYDPVNSYSGDPGVVYAYLESGCYGFFGSSTIAYGPSHDNGCADLICQYFLEHVMSGASTGRAVLEARQDFVGSATILDPFDLKTLIQFNLMGDPSIHPVKKSTATRALSKSFFTGAMASVAPVAATAAESARGGRRRSLARKGALMSFSTDYAVREKEAKISKEIQRELQFLASEEKLDVSEIFSFTVQGAAMSPAMSKSMKLPARALPGGESRYYVLAQPPVQRNQKTEGQEPVSSQKILIAREELGSIVSYRSMYRR
jgi:peptidase C25-like protein